MKTCGYCGRENEDSAIVCRECGMSEFPDSAEEKARAVQAQEVVEAEPEIPEPDVASGEEACICPFCLFPNVPDRPWCKYCGSPFNTSAMGPFESALAAGPMWRGVVRGRPRPIVLITIWIWFLPAFILAAASVFLGLISVLTGFFSGVFLALGPGLLYSVISASLLFQVTRNYLTIPKPKLDE
jgi:hypothetical protein